MIHPDSVAAWEQDCHHWRRQLLTGIHSHWCQDWDGLPVDETCPEWPCTCALKGKDVEGLDIGEAVRALKLGARVARRGWNGKDMWLAYSPGHDNLSTEKFWAPANRTFAQENGGTADVLPCITMKNAGGKIVMGWLASQEDLLANDWFIVE